MSDRSMTGDSLETDRLAAELQVSSTRAAAVSAVSHDLPQPTRVTASQYADPLHAPLRDEELVQHESSPLPGDGHLLNETPGKFEGQMPGAASGGGTSGGGGGHGGIGQMLAPALLAQCDGRLSDIHWFRTDWQRGGALTGYAKFIDDAGVTQDAVLKMPVPPCERHWLVELQNAPDVVPKVYAHSDMIGGYDLAWVIMERLPHGPLSPSWAGVEFDLLAQAAGRFYEASATVPLRGGRRERDWLAMYEKARRHVLDRAVPDAQRWKAALKKAHRRLDKWIAVWDERPSDHWVHGDLHLGNAMTRCGPPGGPALLFDFAWTRVGNWIEDGVYLEHLFWAQRERLNGRKLISMLAHQRRDRGLPVGEDWPQLADAGRALMAMSTPATLYDHGNAPHIAASLEVLERYL